MRTRAGASPATDLGAQALRVLEEHRDAARGYCVPDAGVYPYLWLWDCCFHAAVRVRLRDDRALRESEAALRRQTAGGLMPHLRYGVAPDAWLWPPGGTSSLAQPPLSGHALRVLTARGMPAAEAVLRRGRRGLEWLREHRRDDRHLLYVMHPWQAGNGHSPRWDDGGAPGRASRDHDRAARSAWNKARTADVTFGDDGAAASSSTFVACPPGFNAYVASTMAELPDLLDDATLSDRAARISAAMDEHVGDPEQQRWADQALVGGGPSVRTSEQRRRDGCPGPERPVARPRRAGADRRPRPLRRPVRTGQCGTPPSLLRPRDVPAGSRLATTEPSALAGTAALGSEVPDAGARPGTRGAAVVSGWAEYSNPERGR